MMNFNKNQIGFTHFIDKVDCKSQYGKLRLRSLEMLESKDDILREQQLLLKVIKLDDKVKNDARAVLSNIKNISLILNNILIGNVVDIVDLHEVKVQAMHTEKLTKIIGRDLFPFDDVSEIIEALDPNNEGNFTFRLYECYDEDLAAIVKRKREIEHVYFKSDASMKSTVMADRDKIIIEEKVRTDIVLQKIVNQLKSVISKMIANVELLTKCDLYLAKSLVYSEYKYTIVEFSESFVVEGSVLPIVSDNTTNYTPLNIDLNRGSTLIVGANMGGKSTILKNLAFNLCLINYGFLPIADRFECPFLNNIVFVQSYEDSTHGLSRFGGEITALNDALLKLDDKTLFLIDEFASSTNPSEGYLFVKSLINYCNNLNTYTVLTSHYDNLTQECDTYVVSGISEEALGGHVNIHDLMNYEIAKTTDNSIPKQALLVAKHMDINENFLEVLSDNYKEEV